MKNHADTVLSRSHEQLTRDILGYQGELEEIEKRAIWLREQVASAEAKRLEVARAISERAARPACDVTTPDGEIVALGALRVTVTVDGEHTHLHVLTGTPPSQAQSLFEKAILALVDERANMIASRGGPK